MSTDILVNNYKEFGLTHDPFERARRKGPAQWILKHLFYKSNKFFIVTWLSLVIISSVLYSISMTIVGETIQAFIDGNDDIVYLTLRVLLFGASVPIVDLCANLLRETLAQRMERDTRDEFYVSLLGKSLSFHDQQKIGDLMARSTWDVRQLNFLISPALTLILEALVNSISPIILILIKYPNQFLIAPILFSIVFAISLKRYTKKLSPVTTQSQIEFGNLNAILNESLSGIEVIKGMAQENKAGSKYKKKAKDYLNLGIKEGEIQAKYIPILFVALTITFGLLHGTLLYREGLVSIGDIIGYIGLLMILRFPTFISIWSFRIVQRSIAGARRLLEIMNAHSEIRENPEPIAKKIKGHIKFENVSFSYPGTKSEVLKNISFEVLPGQTVAIVGTTGSGKTTLTKLISRLYNVSNGNILVDNLNITNYSLESLRNQISYIEQDLFLFSNSISENIAFGQVGSKEQIIKAAKDAQAYNFIMDLPKQFDSEIGERGVQLSGGERQRLAIARAFLSDPKILILDDSTSAIDSATEELIQRAISRVLEGRTTFLITHRLSQIRWADLILVLKQGHIIAKGTHYDLLRDCEEYRKIFLTRFDKTLEELLQISKEGEKN
ncbi:ABC transporter ATP-binding protein [Promethearchaeum syntrophicum]|uniref:ABC transporter ATP-binding protein n=1 Tax=Promethearchaeum syntrophicum TaxID=2594042 RepID=A0A5B9DCI8_9ARCH|nr:ABC transporter ATP-binding protein [Candidatus Prometheoarchaeum syntrophicum]QEE17019.1 putative ABC transporter ATP-binding protein [Candidatus Prometheoarchaeum syntrophicum]